MDIYKRQLPFFVDADLCPFCLFVTFPSAMSSCLLACTGFPLWRLSVCLLPFLCVCCLVASSILCLFSLLCLRPFFRRRGPLQVHFLFFAFPIRVPAGKPFGLANLRIELDFLFFHEPRKA